MKSKLLASVSIIFFCLTLGMGSVGEQAAVKTPEPDENYTAVLVDQEDVSMDLEKFTVDGQTYLTGKLGKADLSIDFERIRSILFVSADGATTASVTLDDSKKVDLVVAPGTFCYGTSSFADVRIAVRDIKKIVSIAKKQIVE